MNTPGVHNEPPRRWRYAQPPVSTISAQCEKLSGKQEGGSEVLLVIVRQGGAYQLARIDLPSRSLANLTPFPPLGPDVR